MNGTSWEGPSTVFSANGTSGSPSSNASIAQIIQQGHQRIQSYLRSFSNSSSPICRICHEGDAREELLSPCYCSGTIGLVHVSCMERWLSSTNTDTCELCYYKFRTYKTPKSFCEWLRDSTGRGLHQRSLVGDGICFALLTPLAVVSAFLCIEGAHQQVQDGNRMEAGCLVALSTILAVVYFLWTTLTFRFYYRHCKQWQLSNHNVKIMYVKHVTSTGPRKQTISNGENIIINEPNNNNVLTEEEPEIGRNSPPDVAFNRVENETEISRISDALQNSLMNEDQQSTLSEGESTSLNWLNEAFINSAEGTDSAFTNYSAEKVETNIAQSTSQEKLQLNESEISDDKLIVNDPSHDTNRRTDVEVIAETTIEAKISPEKSFATRNETVV